jgi:hypothetical protein
VYIYFTRYLGPRRKMACEQKVPIFPFWNGENLSQRGEMERIWGRLLRLAWYELK